MEVLNKLNSVFVDKLGFAKLVGFVVALSVMQLISVILNFPITFIWLAIPLFYIYTKYEIIEKSQLIKELLLHYVIAILVMAVPYSDENYYYEIINLPYLVFYSFSIYSNLLARKESDYSNQVINYIGVFSFYLVICVFIIAFTTIIELSDNSFAVKDKFVHIGVVFFMFLFSLVSYLTFSNQEMVEDMGDLLQNNITENNSDAIIAIEDRENRVLEFFRNNRMFLENSFSLDQLAKEVGLTKQEVSEVINQSLNSSFYQLLAKYRIDYAKTLLIRNKNLTIDAIVDECGFCSKSTFNKYFKLYVGQTPSVFRSQVA